MSENVIIALIALGIGYALGKRQNSTGQAANALDAPRPRPTMKGKTAADVPADPYSWIR